MMPNKNDFSTKFNFDFNTALGSNWQEKIDSLFISMFRASRICKKTCGIEPNAIIVSPIVYAIMKVTKKIEQIEEKFDDIKFEIAGKFYEKFYVFIDDETFEEHHIIMTHIEEGFFPSCPTKYVKLSISNFIMSNLFGYYNLS
jgi:hypothetical protein